VKELNAMGYGDLSGADYNGDGVVDLEDVALSLGIPTDEGEAPQGASNDRRATPSKR
jgi:hypothetical protein